jgi:hypothetical protein
MWRASIVSKERPVREGTVVLNDQGGTWNFANQSVKNPCVGILSPIVIKRATADKLVFEIKSSEALEGCRDNVAILKRE